MNKMQYFEWVEKYRQNQLSPVDRLAFEHELSENKILRKELEVMELTDLMLSETIWPTGMASGPTKNPIPFKKGKKLLFSALVLLLVICPLLFFGLFKNQEPKETPQPTIERELAPTNPLPEKNEHVQKDNRPIASNTQQRAPKINSSEKLVTRKRQNPVPIQKSIESAKTIISEVNESIEPEGSLKNKTQRVALYKVRAVLDTVLSENSDIALTATEEVRLKPGFHAKPGTSFSARAVAGPAFDPKSSTN